MGAVFKHLADGDFAMWAIIITALVAIGVICERVKTLFFDFSLKADAFFDRIKTLVMADKIEEAITLCGAHEKAPLAHVVKGILERADQDEKSIDQAVDVKFGEVFPKLHKGFGFLAMVANVATLLGLLGTVHGLIMAFEAVSFADPAQKQMMLAQSISIAMVATMMGLFVAIPVMFFYAFLHARQNKVSEEIVGTVTKVVDLLKSRNYEPFQAEKVYATNANGKSLPPVPVRKSA